MGIFPGQQRIQVSAGERQSYISSVGSSVRVDGALKQAMEVTRLRIVLAIGVFAFAFIAVTFRLFTVTFFNGEMAENPNTTPTIADLQFERGDIVDRNGILLASNLSTASLYANPKQLIDAEEVAAALHQIFPELNLKELQNKLISNKSFVWIKRNLTPKEQYLVNNLGQPGLNFKNEERRVYTQGRLFSHLLGYVGIDGHGLAGIEKQFDEYLVSEKAKDEQLHLSLDVRVQDVLHQEIRAAISEFHAIGGLGLIMDVNTGEIIASVSLPDFDPNNFSSSSAQVKFNRNTSGVYEMGSIFKAFTIAMGLDVGKIGLGTVYDTTKPIKIGGFTIDDFHPEDHPLNVAEIFMHSSNIGAAKIAVDVGAKTQQDYLKNFGLLDSLEIELPEKASPMLPKQWRKISSMTVSYGHGIAVTPIQLISGVSAIINGGYYHKPTLIKKSEEQLVNDQGKQVVKKQTSMLMRKLFRLVVKDGTGQKADAEGYLVGGKTGTADKMIPGGYSTTAKLSSFVGAFPINEPKYAVLVLLDEPKGNASTSGYATGGMTAAPVVGKVVSRIAPILGIPTIDENTKNIRDALNVKSAPREKNVASN